MSLTELKLRLGLPESDTSNDSYLMLKLQDAIHSVESMSKSTLSSLGTKAHPIIEDIVRFDIQDSKGILSESIGGMTQTFESLDARNKYLYSQMRKLGILKIKVTPFMKG